MFIAHLPAGYLLTDALTRPLARQAPGVPKGLMAAGLAASVLPDLDLFWFYLVDARHSLHHAYISHMPLFWVAMAGALWLGGRALGWRSAGLFAGVMLANLLLHMALDSVAAGIGWLRPFSDWKLNLVTVPARHGWWVWNFALHWTFALELSLCAAAAVVFARRRRTLGLR